MPADRDLVLAKASIVDRCLASIASARGERREVLLPAERDDIVLVNLQRATQATIDLAAHVAAADALGTATSQAEAFTLLERAGYLNAALAERMRKMVGFRNVAVHAYHAVDPEIVEAIVTTHLGDLRAFVSAMLARIGD